MSKGPCLCGDTECPWCGCNGWPDERPTGQCEVCGSTLVDDEQPYICDRCSREIKDELRGAR